MAGKKSEALSAQVLLLPASGKRVTDPSALTAARLSEAAPSPEAARRAARAWAEAGFEVGPVVGTSFSITAPAATFEKAFGKHVHKAAQEGRELSLDEMDEELTRGVAAVTFTPPPDFGPSSY